MNHVYVKPAVVADDGTAAIVDAEWAFAGLVAAITGIAVSVVIYICSVCDARSFDACLQAVRDYFDEGC